MKRLLLVGQVGSHTGFARVLGTLGQGLDALGYDVHYLGLDVYSAAARAGAGAGGTGTAVPIRGTVHAIDDPLAVYPTGQLTRLVDQLQPDLALVLNDFWLTPLYVAAIRAARHRTRTVAYVPIDGPVYTPEAMTRLGHVDALVVYSEFGRRVVLDCAERGGCAPASVLWHATVIPHGVDTERFRPLVALDAGAARGAARRAARRALFAGTAEWPALEDAFIVLNANRNQVRKRLNLTLEGFALFSRNKPPDVRLYLHTGLRGEHVDVLALARRLGLAERLILSADAAAHPIVDDVRLNLIYNACDVGLNTASGEGWGLVSFEHAATGAAQVVPRHSACAALWDGAAELVAPARTVRTGLFLEGGLVAPADVAAALERLYRDHAHRARLAGAAFDNATQPAYRWECIVEQWDTLFGRVLAAPASRS